MSNVDVSADGLEILARQLSIYVNDIQGHNRTLHSILTEIERADCGDSQLPTFRDQLGGSVQKINEEADKCSESVPIFKAIREEIISFKGPTDTPKWTGGDAAAGGSARRTYRQPFSN